MESNLFFLKQRIFRGNSVRIYHQLLSNQKLSIDELNELNWQKRKQLITHAFNTVPYYRKRFKECGITPEDINKPDDWNFIPLLTRTDLLNSFESLKSNLLLPKVFSRSMYL